MRINNTYVDDFKPSNFDFGVVYFIESAPGQITSSLFDKKEKICFINCPFAKAIKVPIYIQEKGGKFVRNITNEINCLTGILEEDNDSQHFDYLAITLFNELKTNDIILTETTGLSKLSVIRLMRLCKALITTFEHKKIFIVEVNNA